MLSNALRVIYGIFAALIFLLIVVLLQPYINRELPSTKLATVLEQGIALEKFKLQSSTGKIFDNKALRGQWTLLFFGYMDCPDICPSTLNVIKDTFKLEPKLPLRFAFVNLRPVKDPLKFKAFLANYNPNFIGLYGTKPEVSKLSNKLGVYQQEQGALLDHSGALLLIDKGARLRAIFNPPFNAEQILMDLKAIM